MIADNTKGIVVVTLGIVVDAQRSHGGGAGAAIPDLHLSRSICPRTVGRLGDSLMSIWIKDFVLASLK